MGVQSVGFGLSELLYSPKDDDVESASSPRKVDRNCLAAEIRCDVIPVEGLDVVCGCIVRPERLKLRQRMSQELLLDIHCAKV